jgi:hypothetical protein
MRLSNAVTEEDYQIHSSLSVYGYLMMATIHEYNLKSDVSHITCSLRIFTAVQLLSMGLYTFLLVQHSEISLPQRLCALRGLLQADRVAP